MPELGDFPPVEHLSRELGIAYRIPAAGRILLSIPVVDHILRADGTVQSEVLATVLDETTGFVSVLAAQPDWGSTAALEMHFPPVAVAARGDLVVDGRVLKAGRRLVFVEAEVRWLPEGGSSGAAAGAGGELGSAVVAYAAGQFAKVGRAAHNATMDIPDPDPGEIFAMALADSALPEPFPRRMGLRPVGPATVELASSDYVCNSSGILHGGVVAAVAVAAAEHAAGAPAVHAFVQYLSAGRTGPFRATAERRYARGTDTCWAVDTFDAGDDAGAAGDGAGAAGAGRPMNRSTVTTAESTTAGSTEGES
jgi:acyl-coenzyme A thioesterase PaaI-like protein